ncbi:MAG: GGDEF domain-containing protein [Desulfovibrionaceae bacterium]|nr:GGDEF domain-containing protein [Desulfovibrionaceae bacterium]
MQTTKRRFFDKIENKVFLIILLTTVATSAAVYAVTRGMFYMAMLDSIRSRTEIVNTYAQKVVNVESFSLLRKKEDAATDLYISQQRELNKIRRIATVRYLYTARTDTRGEPEYVIDGLDLQAPDFRFIGDAIEPDILPELRRCLNGQTVASEDILNTEWGAIFITCWPVRHADGRVAGAMVMEFDAQDIYQKKQKITLYSIVVSIIVATLFILIARVSLHRVSEPFYKKLAYTDYLTGLQNRTAFELDLKRLEEALKPGMVVSVIVYDLNNLKVVNDTLGHGAGDAYIKKMADNIRQSAFGKMGVSYRIGGDEFATVVIGRDKMELEAGLRSLFTLSRSVGAPETYFEFSYGVATWDPELDKHLHDVLIRADHDMYAFKVRHKQRPQRGGTNSPETADDPVDTSGA